MYDQVTKDELAQFDNAYRQAEVKETGGSVPDGEYQVKVDKVKLDRTQNGALILRWWLIVLGPTHQGHIVYRNNVINEKTVGFLKRDLTTCGLNIGAVSELPANLGRLLDVVLEIKKQTKGEYENVYLNRRVQTDAQHRSAEPPAFETPTQDYADDDIPF